LWIPAPLFDSIRSMIKRNLR